MAPDGWTLSGDSSGKKYHLDQLDEEADKGNIYFKSRWIKEKSVVTIGNNKKMML